MKVRRVAWTAVVLMVLAVAAPSLRAQDTATMDHAAMASSYDQEAKDAQAKVASHELMLSRYKSMPSLPKGSATTKEQMIKHCESLVASYKQAAAQATDLAKEHRAMAQAAK